MANHEVCMQQKHPDCRHPFPMSVHSVPPHVSENAQYNRAGKKVLQRVANSRSVREQENCEGCSAMEDDSVVHNNSGAGTSGTS